MNLFPSLCDSTSEVGLTAAAVELLAFDSGWSSIEPITFWLVVVVVVFSRDFVGDFFNWVTGMSM